jgi:hypothetical protein
MYLFESRNGVFHVQARANSRVGHYAGIVDYRCAVHVCVAFQGTAARHQDGAAHFAEVSDKGRRNDARAAVNTCASAEPHSRAQLKAAGEKFTLSGKGIERKGAQTRRCSQEIYIAAALVRTDGDTFIAHFSAQQSRSLGLVGRGDHE